MPSREMLYLRIYICAVVVSVFGLYIKRLIIYIKELYILFKKTFEGGSDFIHISSSTDDAKMRQKV